jgi:ketosteroid isomerase-like protein
LAIFLSSLAGRAATEAESELLKTEAEWSRAMAGNDAQAIAGFSEDSWVIVGADGTTARAAFLGAIASHDLVHDHMELVPDVARVYGDIAIVSGIATSSGTWKGTRFATRERSTDIFHKQDGRWRCVFTQLTPLSGSPH